MVITNKHQRQDYTEATKISVEILRQVYEATHAGVTPLELDELAGKLCKKYHVRPAFYFVPGRRGLFHHNACIYVNDVAVHGMPNDEPIKPGDLVKLDFGLIYKDLYTDHCVSVGIESIKPSDHKLLEIGRDAVWNAAHRAIIGKTTGDVGHIMESTARKAGFDTIKEYIGHGIGYHLHEEPEQPAYGKPGKGEELEEGMVICVEAQVVAGKPNIIVEDDGWTVRTQDGHNAVMFEYMVIVGKNQPKILTDTYDWELVKK